MKKLSRELIKSHILLITMFISVLVVTYFYSAYSLFRQSKNDVKNVEKFLVEELSKPQHQDIDDFFHSVIIESPQIDDLSIVLTYEDKALKNEGTPNLEWLPSVDKIQEVGFYDYYVIKNSITTPFGKKIDFTIIRGLQEEKTFLLKKLKIYSFGSLLIIIVGFIISSYFYKKVIPQLSKLEDITNKINLHSFHSDVKKEDIFLEFYNIIISYENMLTRLEKQASSQIDFINNASHELRTPIFVIGGYVDLIKRWGFNDKEVSKEAFDYIQSEVNSMGILIEKLLFLAKQDKIELFHEDVYLAELMKEIIKEMEIIYPEQIFNLTLTSANIISDSSLVKQLIRNLLSNAIKYGRGKPIDIAIECSSVVTLTILDRGSGMSQEELSRSFEKFFRGDKSRDRKSQGHGLGLPIVKQILSLLGGSIEIKSEKNKGTSVEVHLPISLK